MRQEYRQDDGEEILRRAIAIDAMQGHNKEVLLKTAEELGISKEAVEQAEREYFTQQKEQGELAEFIRHQRRGFYSHLWSYVVVNSFLVCMDFFSNGRLEWAYWPVFGWGIGMAFHALSVFNTQSEDFQKEFEQWREQRRKALASSE